MALRGLRVIGTVLLLFGLFAVSGNRSGADENGTRWALLVGVADYESDDIADLRFTVNDVKAVSQALVASAGFARQNVLVMTSDLPKTSPDYPSSRNVARRLAVLSGRLQPADTLLFYFSGHGFSRGDQSFLATADTDPLSLITLRTSSLPMEGLKEEAHRLKARRRAFILDCCRDNPEGKGEASARRTAALTKDLVQIAKDAPASVEATQYLFACSEGERSFEWPEKRHGVFTYYLLDGLRGRAADGAGRISVQSLGRYVQSRVPRAEYLIDRGFRQTPEFQQFGAPEIVLAAKLKPPSPFPKPGPAPARPTLPPAQAGVERPNEWDGAVMVYVPPGEFTMGSNDGDNDEKPPHRVRITRGFWLAKTEVTNEQYGRFMKATGRSKPKFWDDPQHNDPRQPVVGVTWEDAEAYCRWAGCRLPTEAEWEYAARGSQGSRTYPWGEEAPAATRAVFNGVMPGRCGERAEGASWCGALDLAGNVWEWCGSWYSDYQPDALTDPAGPANGAYRVLRGGSWDTPPVFLRTTSRYALKPLARSAMVGFRTARSD